MRGVCADRDGAQGFVHTIGVIFHLSYTMVMDFFYRQLMKMWKKVLIYR